MTLAAVEVHLVGPEWFTHDIRRVGNQRAAVHGDAATSPDKAGPALAANRFPREWLAIHHHPVGVLVTRTALFDEDFHRTGIVGARRPLHNVVVVLTPVEFADVEAVRTGVSIIGNPGRRPEVKIPVQ